MSILKQIEYHLSLIKLRDQKLPSVLYLCRKDIAELRQDPEVQKYTTTRFNEDLHRKEISININGVIIDEWFIGKLLENRSVILPYSLNSKVDLGD